MALVLLLQARIPNDKIVSSLCRLFSPQRLRRRLQSELTELGKPRQGVESELWVARLLEGTGAGDVRLDVAKPSSIGADHHAPLAGHVLAVQGHGPDDSGAHPFARLGVLDVVEIVKSHQSGGKGIRVDATEAPSDYFVYLPVAALSEGGPRRRPAVEDRVLLQVVALEGHESFVLIGRLVGGGLEVGEEGGGDGAVEPHVVVKLV